MNPMFRKMSNMPMCLRPSGIFLAALVCLGSAVVAAEPFRIITGVPDRSNSAARERTVQELLPDLDSENPEVRAGAVMLLGKYRTPDAQGAVESALLDESVRVRRAAVSALLEDLARIPPTAAIGLVGALGDEDAEIRRLVSFSLPIIVSHLRHFAMLNRQFSTTASGLSERQQTLIIQAYTDEDVQVRRNMLAADPQLMVRPPAETWARLLIDEDLRVRSAALPLAAGRARADFIRIAPQLAEDSERAIRHQLARQIGDSLLVDLGPVLRHLMEDPDPGVAAEARLALLRISPSENLAAAIIREDLQHGQLTLEQTERFLMGLAPLMPASGHLFEEILAQATPPVRLAAARATLRFDLLGGLPKVARLILDDESANVREQAARYFRMRPDSLPPELLEDLAFSPHSDIRALAAELSAMLPNAEAFPLLLDLLLDDTLSVRIHALRELHRREHPRRLHFLARSLHADAMEVQRAAVQILLTRPSQEELDILQNYLREHPSEPLAAFIRNEFRRRGLPVG